MLNMPEIVSHCAKFTHRSRHLCDYGQQAMVVASLALLKSGQKSMTRQVVLQGRTYPMTITTNGHGQYYSMPGQIFEVTIQGPFDSIYVEMYLNLQSVHQVLHLEALFALITDDLLLDREDMLRIQRQHFQEKTRTAMAA